MSVERKAGNAAVDAAASKAAKMERLGRRWGGHTEIFSDGFTALPRSFLRHAAHLQPYSLTPIQILFVAELMYHKWDERNPFPSYQTIADRMGRSVQYTRDVARSLERKGYLRRIVRVGQPNEFDLQPLFDAIAKRVAEDRVAA
jgi:hypothetical protein